MIEILTVAPLCNRTSDNRFKNHRGVIIYSSEKERRRENKENKFDRKRDKGVQNYKKV